MIIRQAFKIKRYRVVYDAMRFDIHLFHALNLYQVFSIALLSHYKGIKNTLTL